MNDTISPTINISVNDTEAEYGIESVSIDFNASDQFIDSVIANVTYPNGTLLGQFTDQSQNIILVPANLTELGRYNITVFANDTSGNTNTSIAYFNVNDTLPPTKDISINDTAPEFGYEYVLINITITDPSLDFANSTIIYPNGTLLFNQINANVTLELGPENLTSLGIYNISVFANDTLGRFNIENDSFDVADTTAPAINISINDTELLFGNESVRIDFNASDYFLDSVIANVTDPNGTLLQQLTNQSIDFIFGPDNLTELGDYIISVFANDTTGSSNTATTIFSVSTVAARGGGGPLYVVYTIVPKEREPIYIPVKELPPVEKKIPPEEIEEEKPIEVEEEIREVPIPIGIPRPPRVEVPVFIVPLGFTFLQAILLFSALALFIWKKKKY